MLILASGSPRRRELLNELGLFFEVITSNVDENINEARPIHYVEKLAYKKAENIGSLYPNDVVIGADTIVVHDGNILGKPADEHEARDMLMKLSGKVHEVYTGVCIYNKSNLINRIFYERTLVEFYPIKIDEVNHYILTGEPFDKAGAYGIQGMGKLFVKGIDGDYFNVVGLPIGRVYRELFDSQISPLINFTGRFQHKEECMLIVTNAFDGTEKPLEKQKVYKEVKQEGNLITLENGVVLELVYGGKLFDKNTGEKYAAVYESPDDDSIGALYGYIKVNT